MNSTAVNAFDSVREFKRKELLMDSKAIVDGFKELNKNSRRTVPANIFVTYFLPIFSGEIEDTALIGERLKIWYRISDGPFNEVDILDQSNTIIAVVPKIYNNYSVGALSSRQVDLKQLMIRAEENPLTELGKFNNVLFNMGVTTTSSVVSVESQEWEKLLNVFGRTLVKKEAKKDKVKSNVVSEIDLDF